MAFSRISLLIAFTLLSLVSLSSAKQDLRHPLHRAADVLWNTNFSSMSLTLRLLDPALFPNTSAWTIFAVSDDAFLSSGQPSMALLKIHFSPILIPEGELQFLPFGSEIPTLNSGRSLTVTTRRSDNGMSIDYVRFNGTSIYNDGVLALVGTDSFFNLDLNPGSLRPLPLHPGDRSSAMSRRSPQLLGICSLGFMMVASLLILN